MKRRYYALLAALAMLAWLALSPASAPPAWYVVGTDDATLAGPYRPVRLVQQRAKCESLAQLMASREPELVRPGCELR